MTTLADLMKPQNVSSYYDTRIGLTDPGNKTQLAALNAAKTGAAAPLDPAMTQQIWSVLASDPNNVDPSLTKARDYLMQNGMLNLVPANEGESNTAARYELGLNAPHNFSGYSLTGDTPAVEQQRLSSVQQVQGNGQKLFNPNLVSHDPLYGDMTLQGNVNPNESGLAKTFWKVAPMLPAAFAAIMSGGALAPLLSQMPEAGATAADAGLLGLDAAPGWTQGFNLDKLVKSGISSLNSNDGKFNPLGLLSQLGGSALGNVAGGLGVPSWITPALSAAMNANKSPIGAGLSLAQIFGRAGQ